MRTQSFWRLGTEASGPLTAHGKGRASSARQLQRSQTHSALFSHQHTFLAQKWQQTCCEGVTGRAEPLGREDTLSMGRPWRVSVCDPFQAIPTPHRNCTPFIPCTVPSSLMVPQYPAKRTGPGQEHSPGQGTQGDTAAWDSAGQQKLQGHSCCIHPGAVHAHPVGTFPGARGSGNAGCHSLLAHCTAPTSLCKLSGTFREPKKTSRLTPDSSFPARAGPTSALQTAVLQSGLP